MRAEYNMLDGLQVYGGVRDGVVPGDVVDLPIPSKVIHLDVAEPSVPTRKYRVTGYVSLAILEEVNE